MGTEARIVLFAPDSVVAEEAARAAFARIAGLDRRLSDYRVDSEVSRLAESAGAAPVPVSGDLLFVLTRALAAAAVTEGAFDPTSSPLVRLWREARQTGELPDSGSIRNALARTGWRNVAVDTVARTVRLGVPGMGLDFGAIAKGYAADEALAELRSHGVRRALVDFGGEIVAGDAPPGATGWAVRTGDDISGDTVRLAAGAISTSGAAEQFVEIGGARYSHVVDPRTGLGLTNGRSATVRAPAAWMTDLVATAATVVDSAGLERLRRSYPEATITIW